MIHPRFAGKKSQMVKKSWIRENARNSAGVTGAQEVVRRVAVSGQKGGGGLQVFKGGKV